MCSSEPKRCCATTIGKLRTKTSKSRNGLKAEKANGKWVDETDTNGKISPVHNQRQSRLHATAITTIIQTLCTITSLRWPNEDEKNQFINVIMDT